ncbi:C6 transcription factor [Pseudohyphozyma bogoriensis]|nr:C6 transcription factor [Pseudohyphozyma bogoriensis]
MVESGRQGDVCPIWLGQYCMILSLALDGFKIAPTQVSAYEASHAFQLYSAAQRLLNLGDWQGAPQARCITTAILVTQYCQFSQVPGQVSKFMAWLAGAIRIAQLLGLHKLGDDPETMPLDDPSWPPGKNSVKRQSALRLFGSLLFMDWLSAGARFPSYMLHENQFTTGYLMNVNDADLSPTDWKVEPLPRTMVTDVSFEHMKRLMATQGRKAFDKLITSGGTLSFDEVKELDAGYRRLLEDLPDQFKTEHTALEQQDPKIRWRRHGAQAGVHSRIMRLHRPFLSRGYLPNSPFRHSTDQCVASAKIVISSHHNLIEQSTGAYFLYIHSISASLVLFLDLFHAIDNGCSAQELHKKKEPLIAGYEVFSRNETIPSHRLRGVVQQGARIMSGLFLVATKRRATREAYQNSPPSDPCPPLETFAQVLARISRDLANPDSTTTIVSDPASLDAMTVVDSAPAPPPVEASVDMLYNQFADNFFRDLTTPGAPNPTYNSSDLSFLSNDYNWLSDQPGDFTMPAPSNGLPGLAEQLSFSW